MNTLADLKRELVPGKKLRLIYRNSEKVSLDRTVVKIQSNGVWVSKDGNKPSWLEYPKSTLLGITPNGFRIYWRGKRPLTPEEKRIRDNAPEDQKQAEIDALTDGSTMYWRVKRYFKEHNAEYLMGTVFECGMRYDPNTGMVDDDKVKGDLSLEYEFFVE